MRTGDDDQWHVQRALVVHRDDDRTRARDVRRALDPKAEPSSEPPAADHGGEPLEPPGAERYALWRLEPEGVDGGEHVADRVRRVERLCIGEVHAELALDRHGELRETERVDPDVLETICQRGVRRSREFAKQGQRPFGTFGHRA